MLDTDKVSSEWTTENGINGRKFTDKTTGNSIFLPAVGYRNDSYGGGLLAVGRNGYYWSSTVDESLETRAGYLYFYSVDTFLDNFLTRSCGFSVRAVAD